MNDDDRQLEDELRQALTVRSTGPRQDDIEHLRYLATQRSVAAVDRRDSSRGRRMSWAVGAVAASIALAFFAGTNLGDTRSSPTAQGVAEFDASLPAASGTITVAGRLTGIGRTVTIETNELPILPLGEYYEVWFVAKGDTPTNPDRISAGTFHPDTEGNTDVLLTAAVDPAKYPTLAITAEPADGDPAPSDEEIARGDLIIKPR